MNIQVIPRHKVEPPMILDWSDGFTSHLELWVAASPPTYTSMNMLHRAGTFVLANIEAMDLDSVAYHLLVLFKGLDDLRENVHLRSKPNTTECVQKTVESLKLLLAYKDKLCLDILMVAQIQALIAQFDTVSVLILPSVK